MTEALFGPRSIRIAIFLGIYSALLALLPDPGYRLLALAPLLLVSDAWWTLIGAADRWLLIFLCAAILLPPLPITLLLLTSGSLLLPGPRTTRVMAG